MFQEFSSSSSSSEDQVVKEKSQKASKMPDKKAYTSKLSMKKKSTPLLPDLLSKNEYEEVFALKKKL